MIGQLARMALALPRFLRAPLTAEAAHATLERRFAARAERFLELARTLIFDHQRSPYLPLLRRAGCAFADLEAGVRRDGLEPTLAALRDAGVRVALAELKGLAPIERPGLVHPVRDTDFDSPSFGGSRIDGATSGSRGGGTRVGYDWALIEEQAATELVLHELHGTTALPLVLWLPPLPSIAGMQAVLANLKFGRAPAAWYSPVDPRGRTLAARHRLANAYLLGTARLLGRRIPRPVLAPFDDAARVAAGIAARRPCVVRTYVSAAVRLAKAAREAGLDLAGCTILCGGEPLTEARRAFVEASGARIVPRYSTTEAGQIGASCPHRTSADDMHVYLDRVALLEDAGTLLVTTLSRHTGKVLLNADLGDTGRLARRPCDCALGRLGFDLHVCDVRSGAKVTAEGMNVIVAELDHALAELVAAAGGSPDDYQFREAHGDDGLAALEILIDPAVPGIDDAVFREALLARLAAGRPAAALTTAVWSGAGTLRIVRERPRMTRGYKLPRVTPK